MGKYTYNKSFFEKIDSEEKAYWLGFLYADGCITRFYKGEDLRSMSLELTLTSTDKGHLFSFLKALDANVPIVDKKVKLKDKEYSACRLVVNNTKICNDLIKLGCVPAKSLILTFPTEEQVPKYLTSHFIRGYFDGDGCIYHNVLHNDVKNPHWNQNRLSANFTGTESFLKSVKLILEEEKISVSQIYQKSGQKAYTIYLYGKKNINSFYNFLAYANSKVSLKRKYDKFQEIFQKFNFN